MGSRFFSSPWAAGLTPVFSAAGVPVLSATGSGRRPNSSTGEYDDQRGVLVELLVVITIIALIMGIVGPRVLGYLSQSKAKAAKIQIESFASALDLYYLDTGRYPGGSEGLAALVRKPANVSTWNGPYLKGGVVPPDPWGNPYVYRSPGQNGSYDILSYGSDGSEGGTGAAQDITSWQR